MVLTRSVSQQTQAMAAPAQVVDSSNGVLSKACSFSSRPLRQTQTPNPRMGHPVSRRHATKLSPIPLSGQKRGRSDEGDNVFRPDSEAAPAGSSMRALRSTRLQERLSSLQNDVTIVYDRRHSSFKNTRLRGTSDLSFLPPKANQEGLSDLKLSGSAAITVSLLKAIKAIVGDHQKVLICDLRREPHAVANDHSITWTIPNNWLNLDRPLHEAVQDEQTRIHAIRSTQPEQLTAVLHKDYKKELLRPEKKTLVEPRVYSEQEIVESYGMWYARFGVSDHLRPNDAEVDRFLDVMQQMPKDTWVHMHCKGGQGRTTTFMVLYDILRNVGKVSLLDIVNRQKHLGFDYDVSSEGLKNDRKQFRQDRWAFIRDFYEFAKTKPLETNQSWSEWKAARASQS